MDTLDESLAKIARGTGIAFAGSLAGLLFAFIGRLLVARIGSETEYGVFSLAFVILSIAVIIATLGLQQGVARSIAYARGRNDGERVQKLIAASIHFGLLASVALAILLFALSNVIATGIFNDPDLGFPLRIFALGIPFFTIMNVLTAIFLGFDDVKPMAYFLNILRGALFPLFILPVLFLDLPFNAIFYAFLGSIVTSCAALIVYSLRRMPTAVRLAISPALRPVAKDLILFSLPLLGVAMLYTVITWTDTLMLGGLKGSVEVGLYNAALPLAGFISIPLTAMLFIYMPIVSGLFSQGAIPEMRRNYSILTKWLFSATLPLFLILFLFPEAVLTFLFGASYAAAADALRILALGFIINNLFGPTGGTLLAMGKTQTIMWATIIAASLNVGLNIALIPPLGIEGAAIASAASITLVNLIYFHKLYSSTKSQPLSRNLLKPVLSSLAFIFLIQFIFTHYVTVEWWMLPLLFVLYYIVYGAAIVLTKSFDAEDLALLRAMGRKAGVDASTLKRVFRKR